MHNDAQRLFDRLLYEYRVGHRMATFPDIVSGLREIPTVRVKKAFIPQTYLRDRGVDYVPPRNGKRPRR